MQNDNEVVEYLKKNKDFFDKHQDVLAEMDFSQIDGSSPFHIRQIEVLKERDSAQRNHMEQIVDTVRSNQSHEKKLYRLAIELLKINQTGLEIQVLEKKLASVIQIEFDVDDVSVFYENSEYTDIEYDSLARRVAHKASSCDDRLSSELREALFGGTSTNVESCAFIPLLDGQSLTGVLVLGSNESARFQPDMGTLFLDRIGELIAAFLMSRADSTT